MDLADTAAQSYTAGTGEAIHRRTWRTQLSSQTQQGLGREYTGGPGRHSCPVRHSRDWGGNTPADLADTAVQSDTARTGEGIHRRTWRTQLSNQTQQGLGREYTGGHSCPVRHSKDWGGNTPADTAVQSDTAGTGEGIHRRTWRTQLSSQTQQGLGREYTDGPGGHSCPVRHSRDWGGNTPADLTDAAVQSDTAGTGEGIHRRTWRTQLSSQTQQGLGREYTGGPGGHSCPVRHSRDWGGNTPVDLADTAAQSDTAGTGEAIHRRTWRTQLSSQTQQRLGREYTGGPGGHSCPVRHSRDWGGNTPADLADTAVQSDTARTGEGIHRRTWRTQLSNQTQQGLGREYTGGHSCPVRHSKDWGGNTPADTAVQSDTAGTGEGIHRRTWRTQLSSQTQQGLGREYTDGPGGHSCPVRHSRDWGGNTPADLTDAAVQSDTAGTGEGIHRRTWRTQLSSQTQQGLGREYTGGPGGHSCPVRHSRDWGGNTPVDLADTAAQSDTAGTGEAIHRRTWRTQLSSQTQQGLGREYTGGPGGHSCPVRHSRDWGGNTPADLADTAVQSDTAGTGEGIHRRTWRTQLPSQTQQGLGREYTGGPGGHSCPVRHSRDWGGNTPADLADTTVQSDTAGTGEGIHRRTWRTQQGVGREYTGGPGGHSCLVRHSRDWGGNTPADLADTAVQSDTAGTGEGIHRRTWRTQLSS